MPSISVASICVGGGDSPSKSPLPSPSPSPMPTQFYSIFVAVVICRHHRLRCCHQLLYHLLPHQTCVGFPFINRRGAYLPYIYVSSIIVRGVRHHHRLGWCLLGMSPFSFLFQVLHSRPNAISPFIKFILVYLLWCIIHCMYGLYFRIAFINTNPACFVFQKF